MKRFRIYIQTVFLAALISLETTAQKCELPIAILLDEQIVNIPTSAMSVLGNTLNRIANQANINVDLDYAQFVLTVSIDQLDKSIIPGPPAQVVHNLGVTFYIADVINKKKFSTAYLEIKGVGKGENKAITDAFRHLNSNNKEIKGMLADAQQKILSYYDTQYPNILKEAKRKASLQLYEEALTMAISIPSCSQGGDEAMAVALEIYTKYLNKVNLVLLNKAKLVWAANQTIGGASDAGEYLALIDPDAACYEDAMELYKEMKAQVRKDLDFEMREKYADAIKLEEQRIDAIKAIGVAYGNNQKPTTTNLAWLR